MESMQDNSIKKKGRLFLLFYIHKRTNVHRTLIFAWMYVIITEKNVCLESEKMSKFHMETVKCPKCHSHFQFKVWDSVNVDLNREEKEKILDGTFYDTDCPFCHTRIHGIYGFCIMI